MLYLPNNLNDVFWGIKIALDGLAAVFILVFAFYLLMEHVPWQEKAAVQVALVALIVLLVWIGQRILGTFLDAFSF